MCRSEDADLERLLLDDVGDGERKQKDPALRVTHIGRRPVSFGIDHGFFRNEEGFHHDAEILAENHAAGCDRRSIRGLSHIIKRQK
jgi:hypothetical protein